MICNVRGAKCPWSSCDNASAPQEVASLDVLNRQIHLPACDGWISIESCSMKVHHILSKDEVCTTNARRRESWASCFASSWKSTVPRFTREFEAHHLVLRLRSCSCATGQVFCFQDFTQSKPSNCMPTQCFIMEEAGLLVKTIAVRTR